MTEALLWQLIKRNITGHLIRIENTSGSGTPDVNACDEGNEVWIELKLAKVKFIYFRTAQLAWFAKRISAKGLCKIVWRKQNVLAVTDCIHILNAMESAVPVKNQKSVKIPIDNIPHVKFPKPWCWKKINQLIYSVLKDANT